MQVIESGTYSGKVIYRLLLVWALVLVAWQNKALAQADDWLFVIDGKVKDMDTKRALEGVSVQIFKANGSKVQTSSTPAGGTFKFKADPNQEYTIKVCKNGYVCKIISVSTMNVVMRENASSQFKFAATIELFEEVKGVDYSILEKPIGQIYYNQTAQDFDWNADPFSRKKIEELEEEVRQKQQETKDKVKKEQDQKLKDAEDAVKRAEQEAKDRKKAELDAAKKSEEDAKRKAKDAEDAKLRAASEEKAKAQAEEKRKKEELEKAKLDAKKRAEDEAREKAEAKKREEEEARLKAENERKSKDLQEAEELARRKEESKQRAEREAAEREEAKREQQAKMKAIAEGRQKALDEAKKIYVKSIDYRTEEGTNYIITVTFITFMDSSNITYKKILYNWGGLYFKKDLEDTTGETYREELKKYTVKVD